jgi:hypothetical protein
LVSVPRCRYFTFARVNKYTNNDEFFHFSKNEELCLDSNDIQELPKNCNTDERTESDEIDVSLIDSLQDIEISHQSPIICDKCSYESKDVENIDQKDAAVVNDNKSERECDQQPLTNNFNYSNK